MKRFLVFLTAVCLILGLAVPAMAETESMEDELKEVTVRVKDVLEIEDDYTDFSGNYSDGLRPGWHLNWNGNGRELSVTAAEDGVITEFYRWRDDGVRRDDRFAPHFPRLTEKAARTAAERWLSRLTGEGETARIDGQSVTLTEDGEYGFHGRILKNRRETPVTFSVRVDGEGLVSFSRSDGYAGYVGETPDARPAVKKADAAEALRAAVVMDLYYVKDADGEIRLRYVPVGPYTLVDAQSGEAVDMDALYASFGGTAKYGPEEPAAMEATMADSGGGRGLTEVELSSIANYRDVLSQEKLEAKLKELPGLGLEGFELNRCSYGMDSDGNVTASLRYSCEMTENNLFGFTRASYDEITGWGDRPVVFKYITMDGKTGELLSLSTSYPLWERDGDAGDGSAVAEAFLKACAPERFAQTALREGSAGNGRDDGTYARVHDGYFYPENYLFVSVNSAVGTVDEFRAVWDDEAVFAASKGIVSGEEAVEKYADALTVTLGYAAWPEAIDYDDPVLYRYADWGYTFVESLRLGYYYSGRDRVDGVDALTGEPLTRTGDGTFAYDDLAGCPEKEAIEALGRVGVGFDGGAFDPEKALTQRDALLLLFRAAGYDVSFWEEESLKNEAVWYGFLTAGAWAPEDTVTGPELRRMILGATAYGPAAELTGVWAPAYRDDGWAALGSVLGLGDVPAGTCTRADAAAVLYRFMTR